MQRNGVTSDHRNAFAKLKPLCVALLPRAPLTPDRAPVVHNQLRELQSTLRSVPLAGALLDYAFFPLSQLLRLNSLEVFAQHESVLEECMRAMEIILRPWRRATPPMSGDLLSQVWLVCTLVLGGPLEPPDVKGKGKAKEIVWSEETKLATLSLLEAIIEPIEAEPLPDILRPTSLFSPANGTPAPATPASKPIPLSILAHTLTALLDLIRDEQNNDLRERALDALRHLVHQHIPGASDDAPDLMVQFLPGTASALAASLASTSALGRVRRPEVKASLAAKALSLLSEVVERVVGNRACEVILAKRRRGVAHIDRLEDIVVPHSLVIDPSDDAMEDTGLRSSAWLTATVSQLHVAIFSFAGSVRSHHSTLVRIAYANFCRHCLVACGETLESRTRTMLLNDLLILTCDDWPEVAAAAQADLEEAPTLVDQLQSTLSMAIVALPQTILSHGEDEVRMLSAIKLLRGAAQALLRSSLGAIGDLGIDAERWSFSLLHALQFARIPVGPDRLGSGDVATARAWIASSGPVLAIEGQATTGAAHQPYPSLALRRLPSAVVVSSLRRMFIELARASPALIDHFLSLATGGLDARQRAAAWWLLDASLESRIPPRPGGKVAAKLRRSTRAIIKAIVELHDAGIDNEPATSAPAPSDSTSLIPVDYQRGHGELVTKLDAFAPSGSTEDKARAARAQRLSTSIITFCLSLRTLATAAAVLGSSFRADLLSCLYPLLAQLDPNAHPLLKGHAEVALARIADHAGYPSVEVLVLDNVDYIVNAVSQRLTYARLDPQAPLVLITIIRLVGEPIVPLVQDVVDDIFDALDDYHGYDELCASLLAVLDALVKAMSSDIVTPPPPHPRESGHQLPPDPERDLVTFETWYARRAEEAAKEPEDFGPVPAGGFTSAALEEQEQQEQEAKPEPDEVPPTRTQSACIAMLNKALLFLTHDSAFLRARVLALLASGVPVLAIERKTDLLPIVHRAWPYILNRLNVSEPAHVIAEAAALVEVLGRYAGDFMSRRIVDDTWPRFRTLLSAMDERERGSALKGKTAFTTAQRLYGSIIGAMTDVTRGVPLGGELAWEVALAFRHFFRGGAVEGQEQRRRARSLYEALRVWHPEVVWLALAGGIGQTGLPTFLRLEGLTADDVGSLLDAS